MKTVKIFLASSEELKEERLQLADLVEHLNHTLEKQDVRVQLVKWEYLNSSMGPLHKQEEYNRELRDCEMCLVLYWTKFGMYIKTELDTAYNERCAGNNPRRLYVYFKDGGELSQDLKDFRDSFIKNYGHFFCHFENIDTLKADFLLQFMDYQSKELGVKSSIEISNGRVIIGGKEYVELKNVPFAGNNEEYNLLLKSIKRTRRLISVTDEDDPEYAEYKEELKDLEKKLSTMESNLWEQALLITRLSTSRCSERLERAMSLFNQGDNKGALAVLDEEAIEKDARHNINLLKLADEGRRGLEINIKELEMRIASLECNIAPLDDRTEIVELRKKILEWTEELYCGDSVKVADKLMDLSRAFGSSIIDSQYYQEPIQYALESLKLYKQHFGEGHLSVSDVYTYLGDIQHKYALLMTMPIPWSIIQKPLR